MQIKKYKFIGKSMQSNRHTNHKPKLRLLMLLLILALIISAIPITEPLTVYAEDYNGDKGADTGTVGTGTIGASTTNTAFYMYIVDSKGASAIKG